MNPINGCVILLLTMLVTYQIIIMKCSRKDSLKNLLKYFAWVNMVVWVLVSAYIQNLILIFMQWKHYLQSRVMGSFLVGILVLLLLALLCSCQLEGNC